MAASMSPHPAGPIRAVDLVEERAPVGQPVERRRLRECVRCGRAVHFHERTGRWRHGIEPGWRIIEVATGEDGGRMSPPRRGHIMPDWRIASAAASTLPR